MGPYCKFCQARCFVPVTDSWPKNIQKAFKHFTIAATCPEGQKLDKEETGFCWNDVKTTLKED